MVRRAPYDAIHELFRESFRTFVKKEIVPHHSEWERAGIVAKAMFRRAGQAGFLGMAVPERYGGGGEPDFRFNSVIIEEVCRVGVLGSALCILPHNDVCLPYFLSGATEEQKERWLPSVFGRAHDGHRHD